MMSLEDHLESLGIPKQYEFANAEEPPVTIDFVNQQYFIFNQNGSVFYGFNFIKTFRLFSIENHFSDDSRIRVILSRRRVEPFTTLFAAPRTSSHSFSVRWVGISDTYLQCNKV